MSRTRSRPVFAGLAAGAVGAALLATPQAAQAAPSIVGPAIVQAGGNLTISDSAAPFNATNAAVQISATACAAKFAAPTATGPWNAAVSTRSTTAVAFALPSGVAGTPNGGVRSYNVCVYEGTTVATSNLQGNAAISVGVPAMLSPAFGVTGGGNQLTVNAHPNGPIFTGVTNVGAVFSAGPCSGTLGTTNPAGLVATNVQRQSNTTVSLTVPPGVVSASGPSATMYNLCLYDSSAATGALLSFVPYTVTLVGLTPASGSYLSSNGVTANSATAFLSGVTAPAAIVLGMGAGCPSTYSTAPIGSVTPIPLTVPGAVRRLTNWRAAVTVPPLPLVNSQPTPYQICFYANNTAGGSLVGTGTYMASIVAMPTSVIPSAGPAAGGTTITVVGNDFPTDPGRITATLGGAPLTSIQPVSDKAFTATTPAHAVESNVPLVVTTSAGTRALAGAYSFLNPIKISPNTAPNTAAAVDVSVQGMGFMSINFGQVGTAGRVFLVKGRYDGDDAGGGVRANGPVAECVNVLPISDEELVCTLQLNRRLNSLGGFFDTTTYTNNLNDVSTTAGSKIIVSADGKFGPNDLGQPIVQGGGGNIPSNSIITSVLSPAKAVISQAATSSGSALMVSIGNNTPVRMLPNALNTTAGSTAVTLQIGSFGKADVGRVVANALGVPPGTTIASVSPGGASATLSVPATAGTGTMLTNVTIADGMNMLSGSSITADISGAFVGPNSLGIPVGATIMGAGAGSASVSMPSAGGGTGNLQVFKPVNASLYAGAPVAEGSYNLVVVSNGAADAALTDPDYQQTDVTSSSTFTVAAF